MTLAWVTLAWLILLNYTCFLQIMHQSLRVAGDNLAFAKLLEGNSRGQPLSFNKICSLDYKLQNFSSSWEAS